MGQVGVGTRQVFDAAAVQFQAIRRQADGAQVGEVLGNGVAEDEFRLRVVVQGRCRDGVVDGVDLGARCHAGNP